MPTTLYVQPLKPPTHTFPGEAMTQRLRVAILTGMFRQEAEMLLGLRVRAGIGPKGLYEGRVSQGCGDSG